jgi:hypothetical protein
VQGRLGFYAESCALPPHAALRWRVIAGCDSGFDHVQQGRRARWTL